IGKVPEITEEPWRKVGQGFPQRSKLARRQPAAPPTAMVLHGDGIDEQGCLALRQQTADLVRQGLVRDVRTEARRAGERRDVQELVESEIGNDLMSAEERTEEGVHAHRAIAGGAELMSDRPDGAACEPGIRVVAIEAELLVAQPGQEREFGPLR